LMQVKLLEDFEHQAKSWDGDGLVPGQDGKAGRLVVSDKKGPRGVNLYLPAGVRTVEWDELAFDYQFSGRGLKWWGVKIIDYPLAEGLQAVWQIRSGRLLTPGEWHTAVINLREPEARWGSKPNRSAHVIIFRAELSADAPGPVTVLVDNVRYRRAGVRLEVAQVGQARQQKGQLISTWQLKLTNFLDKPVSCRLEAADVDPHLRLPGLPRKITLSAGEKAELTQQVTVAQVAKVPRLAKFTARLLLRDASKATTLAERVIAMTTPLGKVPHPVLLLRRDEVPKVLAAAEKDPHRKKDLDALIHSADSWLTRKLDFPDRGGQWWHWYTCKKCGSRLRTESPTRHVCPNCGAVYTGWPYDDVVINRQHSALASGARDLGLAYLLTGEKKYARRAIQILLGYSERYEKYPLHDVHGRPTGGGHVGPQTLDEATWLIPIAQAFDAVQDAMTQGQRQQIIDHLLLPAAKTTWSPRMSVHNISCWRNSAYALVGLALDREDMVRDAYAGPVGFLQQMGKGVIPPGFWYEGSWGYHFYTMSALLPFVEAGHRAGLDVLVDEYRSLYEAPVEFVAPDMLLPAFNDSGYVNLKGWATQYAIAYRHFHEPRLAWVAHQGSVRGWMALIWAARELPHAEAEFTSKLYPDAGYAVFRTNPWWDQAQRPMPLNFLALDFGPHGGGHGHPDKLNFVWWMDGELMAPDPGSISYGNPMHGGYYKQTLAHNTLVVDGHSQHACTGRSLFFAAEGNLGLTAATGDEAYAPVKFLRIVAVSGARVLDLLVASDSQEHRYEWVYHNRGQWACDAQEKPLGQPPEGAGYKWCHDWKSLVPEGALSVRWTEKDGKGVVLYHPVAEGENLLTARSPDQPPSRLVPMVVEQVQGRRAVFLNVLQGFSSQAPGLKARLLPVSGEGAGEEAWAIEASDGRDRDVLLVSLKGQEVQAAGLRLRGQAALVHFVEGKVRDVLVAGSGAVWLGREKLQ
ncbi:MAG: heparinase II/III family protein, partial [Armatimonadetes bacterium]|nr:heparinase II/III family protein [Armatimonadota bacterium]